MWESWMSRSKNHNSELRTPNSELLKLENTLPHKYQLIIIH
ncbi:hypothetical protein CWATWH0402_543 [Crocosphaera watsonii WH 0402]|uniref:Uncharacterized protein n=3 Tax=Crocosphaera watsonii TaxID=263511 RepID=T2JRS7_CROWT|nr:hypothetical protein CWATWH0003_3869 [Crocosphaera watsonii WH 0003]CCQ59319.1 hypothetical protein CWATWH0005_3142 [Crocosphaera watsonii WH 0005]CCQ67905.1 hypothetical protein CWATWH0402_543 [Crocosphaera watsonii WH 0402]